ncbi:unnamed protein product [Arctia plantaginis]|uniref:Uncharacterized protein n=1 Tax=Arctia plantaginis TaxID=874455 RepID=A0A8S1AZ50_ARCPL|nr:unnamed protein product [Arctia plantaginis]CAB3258723.1 unnamed protein product [Arctia plantaginis]
MCGRRRSRSAAALAARSLSAVLRRVLARLARALARADDATVSKWRNAEAVTPRPHERENVRSARARNERGRAVSQPRMGSRGPK